mgnify:CR=1 FL=1
MRIIKWKIFEELTTKKLYYIGPNPTADTIVTRERDGIKQVLLVQRSQWVEAEPGKWGIPGGFVDTLANRNTKWEEGYETKVHAAKREKRSRKESCTCTKGNCTCLSQNSRYY